MKDLIRNTPHKFFFSIALFFGIIGAAIWKYDVVFDYSYNDQGDIEEFFRLIFGSSLMLVPAFLVMSLIYWLMHLFNRPTRQILNAWHIYLTILSYVMIMSSIVVNWYEDLHFSDSNFELSFTDYIRYILALLPFVIFIVNIIISLVKPIKLDEVDLET